MSELKFENGKSFQDVRSISFRYGAYLEESVSVNIKANGSENCMTVDFMPYGSYSPSFLDLTFIEWNQLLDTLFDKVRAQDWKDFYEEEDVRTLDGYDWELTVTLNDGSEFTSSGTNAFPDNWDDFADLFESLIEKSGNTFSLRPEEATGNDEDKKGNDPKGGTKRTIFDALTDINDMVTGDYVEPQDIADLNKGAEAYQNGDYETAVKYYRKSAAAGNVDALSNLGYCYYYGRSVPVDKTLAKEFWEQAASLGDITAVYKLGDMYHFGDLEQNEDYAHKLYERAFELALPSDDIYVYPDAFLRMLRYYPQEIREYGESPKWIAETTLSGLKERSEEGDHYSDELIGEVEEIIKNLPPEEGPEPDITYDK